MKTPMQMPPIDRMTELFEYNPENGIFVRKKTVSYNARAGDVAGTLDGKGYWKIFVDGRQYFAHRLAWLMVHGNVPPMMIDHRNGVCIDNRIANLRLATHSQNGQNQRHAQSGSKTGLLGVYYDPRCKSYYSKIVSGGRFKWLGYFKSPEAAHQAYISAKQRLHEFCTLTQA